MLLAAGGAGWWGATQLTQPSADHDPQLGAPAEAEAEDEATPGAEPPPDVDDHDSDDLEDAGAGADPDGDDPAVGVSWQRTTEPEDPELVGTMTSVTAGGPGLVAVGNGSGWESVVWTSTDGHDWARVTDDDAIFGASRMTSVTAGGPGLVAVGSDTDEPGPVVWTSPDGHDWERVEHNDAVFAGEGGRQMRAVTEGGPGLVAVGLSYEGDGGAAAVWTSPDGHDWARVNHDDDVFGADGAAAMLSLAPGGPGLVAVGLAGDGEGEGVVAAVWTSPDGLDWTRVDHDESVFGGEGNQVMRSVTEGGPGPVAVGDDDGGDRSVAAVWTSTDGRDWTRVNHDETVFGAEGNLEIRSVTAAGPGLTVVGHEFLDGTSTPAVWSSTDGRDWARVDDDTAFTADAGMASVTAGGPRIVAVGFSGDPAVRSAVWTSP